MKHRSDEIDEERSQSRRSFGKSIMAAAMAVPLVASISEAQKKEEKRRGKTGQDRKAGPFSGNIPPIIIKVSRAGVMELKTPEQFSTVLSNAGVPARLYKHVHKQRYQGDLSEIEFLGSINGNSAVYKNTSAAGTQVSFWLESKPTGDEPNILITRPADLSGGIEIQIDRATGLGEAKPTGEAYFKFKYELTELNKVTAQRVISKTEGLLFEAPGGVFDVRLDFT